VARPRADQSAPSIHYCQRPYDRTIQFARQQSTEADDDEISLLDLAVGPRGEPAAACVGPLLVGLIALGYAFTITPIFTARTLPASSNSRKVLRQPRSHNSAALAGVGPKSPAELYVALLKSTTWPIESSTASSSWSCSELRFVRMLARLSMA